MNKNLDKKGPQSIQGITVLIPGAYFPLNVVRRLNQSAQVLLLYIFLLSFFKLNLKIMLKRELVNEVIN